MSLTVDVFDTQLNGAFSPLVEVSPRRQPVTDAVAALYWLENTLKTAVAASANTGPTNWLVRALIQREDDPRREARMKRRASLTYFLELTFASSTGGAG